MGEQQREPSVRAGHEGRHPHWGVACREARGLAERSFIPSCHFSAHMVSIIQMGSVGSIMAMAMFPKQMAPVEGDAEQSSGLQWASVHLCLGGLPQERLYCPSQSGIITGFSLTSCNQYVRILHQRQQRRPLLTLKWK